jgi:hypothetical protein
MLQSLEILHTNLSQIPVPVPSFARELTLGEPRMASHPSPEISEGTYQAQASSRHRHAKDVHRSSR